MTGAVVANFHEGSRSELLADYLLSTWGTVTPVRRQDDYGIDLYCTLTTRAGQRAVVADHYSVQGGKVVSDEWSCGNRKDIEPGDRLFLLRQGAEPRGIIGSGWASSKVFRGPHWDPDRAAMGHEANYVHLRFEHLVDPDVVDVLPLSGLKNGSMARVNWSTQSSGIIIEPEPAQAVEVAWAQHLGGSSEVDDEVAVLEGALRQRLVAHRSRERALRDARIAAAFKQNRGRLVCEVPGCGFDFLEVYGDLGRGYAQVHHLEPLGSRRRPSRTSLEQLAVVCANCHAMIHLGGQCRSLGSLIPKEASHSRGAV